MTRTLVSLLSLAIAWEFSQQRQLVGAFTSIPPVSFSSSRQNVKYTTLSAESVANTGVESLATTAIWSTTSNSTTDSSIKSDKQVFGLLNKLGMDSPHWLKGRPDRTTRTFNYILGKLGTQPDLAADILQYMQQQDDPRVQPDLTTYNIVLQAHSKTNASQFLQTWQQTANAPRPDTISYNTILSSLVQNNKFSEAEKLLQYWNDNVIEFDCEPDFVSYATLLRGLARKGRVPETLKLLTTMTTDSCIVKPTVECYNEVVYAFAKAGQAGKALDWLKEWKNNKSIEIVPNVQSYNMVLYALSQAKDGWEAAMDVFDAMPDRDAVTYTTLASLACQITRNDSVSRVSSNHTADTAIDRVLIVVEEARNDESICVDAAFISNILYSLANIDSVEIPTVAERLVADMQTHNIRPDTQVYNALLYCWAKAGQGASRALEILDQLELAVEPVDIKTYTTVLDCLAKSREPGSQRAAKELLERMERDGPKPNVQAYTSLVQNYARSRLRDKAIMAAKVLERMYEAGVEPNIITYNAVLNAAEFVDNTDAVVTDEALKVACMTFDAIRRQAKISANHITYGTFLGVLAKLMPMSDRQEMVGLIFRRCCLEGQVSPLVLRKLRQAVGSDEVYKTTLLQGHDERNIPKAWRARVKDVRARDAVKVV